jgi:hypothetical protein
MLSKTSSLVSSYSGTDVNCCVSRWTHGTFLPYPQKCFTHDSDSVRHKPLFSDQNTARCVRFETTGTSVICHFILVLAYQILYGCGTWSLTLREEHRLRVFENRVLRRIFGPKRDKVTGGWRKLHNEELHKLYSSPSVIRMIKSRRMNGRGM